MNKTKLAPFLPLKNVEVCDDLADELFRVNDIKEEIRVPKLTNTLNSFHKINAITLNIHEFKPNKKPLIKNYSTIFDHKKIKGNEEKFKCNMKKKPLLNFSFINHLERNSKSIEKGTKKSIAEVNEMQNIFKQSKSNYNATCYSTTELGKVLHPTNLKPKMMQNRPQVTPKNEISGNKIVNALTEEFKNLKKNFSQEDSNSSALYQLSMYFLDMIMDKSPEFKNMLKKIKNVIETHLSTIEEEGKENIRNLYNELDTLKKENRLIEKKIANSKKKKSKFSLFKKSSCDNIPPYTVSKKGILIPKLDLSCIMKSRKSEKIKVIYPDKSYKILSTSIG